MIKNVQIIFLISALISGVLSIILSSQMSKKYRLPWLSSYFNYLIFMYIFGLYGIIGPLLIAHFTNNQNNSLYITYLGLPFLMLSWYMFIRLTFEIARKELSMVFTLAFFGILSLLLIAFGLLVFKIDLPGAFHPELTKKLMIVAFSGISGLVYLFSLLRLGLYTGTLTDRKDRESYRLFGLFYLIFILGTTAFINLSIVNLAFGYGFLILIFAIHLLPIFFMSMYLDRNFVPPVVSGELEKGMVGFVTKFGISKREAEITELLFMGRSNQEICESLFISLQTVKDHVHRIYLKTGMKNRVQLSNLIRSFS